MSAAAILFAVTMIGGAMMATFRISKGIAPPAWLALLHGIVAMAGLVVFVATVKGETAPDVAMAALMGMAIAALGGSGLFVLYFSITAVGGSALFFMYHLKKRALPVPLIAIHATMAAISLITLLVVSSR